MVPFLLATVVGILILSEVALRLGWGLGKRPLYIADKDIGYLLAPNQQLRRFGKQFAINQYSLRNQSIDPKPPDSTWRVLLLGDSIANGGWGTDQEETISALIERQLSSPDYFQVQVLNASANSWGPRNQVAYLRRYGTFQSQAVILLLNTDDLFATAPTSLPVGRDPNYPLRQPPLALMEVLSRLFFRPRPIPGMAEVIQEKGDRVGLNLAGIAQMQQIAHQANAQFLLALTPLLREVDGTPPRDYERQARRRLEDLTVAENMAFLDFLSHFQQWDSPQSLYQDHIHLSSQGNQLVSQKIKEWLEKL